MAIFKCKMCGGALEINGESVAVCEYCGTRQTLPRLDNDRRSNLYDRANHFRRNNEYDKATGIYEQILSEDNTDAEAYWSLVLCRYGIEYVEDPASHRRIPTVNRAQFTSIFDDYNYKCAVNYADPHQREVYEDEAQTINEIQKGILAISQKEEPFDIFICYKETDSNGRRTPDSVLAQELFFQLKQEGYKVFFSRITLEDKLGTAYEPYIFAALNSAKIMVVMGTRPEHFNAVWVKNEWSRYLSLIRNGERKMLVPAFKDMDPYDLPEEFSHLQALDMSKLGFMQDLVRGIKKILRPENTVPQSRPAEQYVPSQVNLIPLLKRVFFFLEDGDWKSADEYCEKILDIDPENAYAYEGKLMAELHVKNEADLADCPEPFDTLNNYHKAIRFANKDLSAKLTGYNEHIINRNEQARCEGIYLKASEMMAKAKNDTEFTKVASMFASIAQYKDSAMLKETCIETANAWQKNEVYWYAIDMINKGYLRSLQKALKSLESIHPWKDTADKMLYCKNRIAELEAEFALKEMEQRQQEEILMKKKARKERIQIFVALGITAFVILMVCILIFIYTTGLSYKKQLSQTPFLQSETTEVSDIGHKLL